MAGDAGQAKRQEEERRGKKRKERKERKKRWVVDSLVEKIGEGGRVLSKFLSPKATINAPPKV